MGSMLTILAHLLGLSIHKSMETASGYEKSKIQLGLTYPWNGGGHGMRPLGNLPG